ncbi:MAG: hypothetical protein WC827_02600 [Candidatus Paceibacterota bacterium]|jgi:hypothetical protein
MKKNLIKLCFAYAFGFLVTGTELGIFLLILALLNKANIMSHDGLVLIIIYVGLIIFLMLFSFLLSLIGDRRKSEKVLGEMAGDFFRVFSFGLIKIKNENRKGN